jgi:hypothetical protein
MSFRTSQAKIKDSLVNRERRRYQDSAALALFELSLKGFRLSLSFSDRGRPRDGDDRDYPSADYSNGHYLYDGCSNVA